MTYQISRELMGKIVDEVFDGSIEDASVIEDIYRVIVRESALTLTGTVGVKEALHGPFGWLNGSRGLSEDSWCLESDPLENSEEYFAIPLYALIDPFEEIGRDHVPHAHVEGIEVEAERRMETVVAPDNGTTDEVLTAVLECARAWVPEARIIGNVRAGDIARVLSALTAPQPSVGGRETQPLKMLVSRDRLKEKILQDPDYENVEAGGYLAALSQNSAEAWKPIETAPHACTFLAIHWNDDWSEWVVGLVMRPLSGPWTHWQPLPAPPSPKPSISGEKQ